MLNHENWGRFLSRPKRKIEYEKIPGGKYFVQDSQLRKYCLTQDQNTALEIHQLHLIQFPSNNSWCSDSQKMLESLKAQDYIEVTPELFNQY